MKKMPIGVLGCGQISGIYLQNCTQGFGILEVAACADLVPELAVQRAAEYGIPRACSVEELLADPAIELVLNLTSPQVHTEVNRRILSAGKHVYTEKPFALTRADADAVLGQARASGLRVGCAPDTFLGAGLQTCRKLLDDGAIGTPYAASGLILMGSVWDGMHPNAPYYLQLGWDPLFDMAPYYLTALVFLLGPVRRVTGSTAQLRREITLRNPQSPRFGEAVPVGAPMNAAATLDFTSGAIATLQAAKESFGYTPRLEIYGTEGILYAPDPNMFGGAIQIRRPDGTLDEVPYTHGFAENSRGVGVADMAYAIRAERPHRASGSLASHVIDITLGVFEAARSGQHVAIEPPAELPAPLPPGLAGNPLA
jgi:predicted dehydrogenase